ncbi:MAG: carboxypeptidase regulatory-like domain-containing protein [Candidatus Eisenbacteria bacterium]
MSAQASPPGRTSASAVALPLASLAVVLLTAACALATITLLGYPQELVSPSDRVTVTWEEDERCYVAYGPAPGVYPSRTATEAVRELTFVPADEGMLPGIHFCVVRAVGTGGDSEEFQLIVESPVFPGPTSPPNGSSVSETTTLFEWDLVDRVPYYHVVVSDSEIEISEEEGEIVLSGARVIWQAITGGTSIQYGGADPSGHFAGANGVSPPLMPGFTYNWLVFNNYGNHPLLTSTAGAGLAGFACSVSADVGAPDLVAPPDSVAMAEDLVYFDWADVPDATGYHIYIHESREWGGGEARYPVWDGATTASEAEVAFGSFLPRGEYHWRVVALDDHGAGACSLSRRLDYETETGEAMLVTTNELGEPLPWVFVEMEFSQGGVEVFPIITNGVGVYAKELIPGDYTFRAVKAGHVDTLAQATVRVNETTPVVMELRRAPARIRGTVEDEQGRAVFDATVEADRGSDHVVTHTDADGNFVLTVTSGEWTIIARKQGHESSSPEVVTVSAGDYHVLPAPLVLLGTPGTVSGSVVNTMGNPLPAATVLAESGTSRETATTNGSGAFSLSLAPGRWVLRAEKSGFQGSGEREVEVPSGGSVQVDPPFSLSPVAASVSGRVTNGENAIAGARVVAVPRVGPVVSATTNGYGEFVLLPAPASYAVRAFADGCAPSDRHQVSVHTEDAFAGLELEVVPLDFTVAGRVTDGHGPVGSARVTSGTLDTVTSVDGTFVLALPSGVHDLRVGKPGYFSGPATRVAGGSGQVLSGLTMRVADGACSISGSARSGGAAVPHALVSAASEGSAVEVPTDDVGGFAMSVESGVWIVRAWKDGFVPSPAETVRVADGQNATGVSLDVLDESAAVLGAVTDDRGPVRRADVLVFVPGGSGPVYRTTSGSSGGYRVRVAPNESYVVRAGAPGRGTVAVEVPALGAGDERIVNVTLPSYDGVIEGVVSALGDPVAGASVTVSWGDSVSAATDRLGRFAVWLDEGLYDVRVERPGYETLHLADVEVVSGEPTRLLVELSGVFASLAGSVIDSLTAAPVEGALLTVTWPEGGASRVTGPEGACSLTSIVPGDVVLRCVAPGYRPETLCLSLGAFEAGAVEIDLLQLTGTISGTVVGGTAGGLPAVSVRAKLGDEVVSTATTEADGKYLLTGLDPLPTYSIRASLDGYYSSSENPLTGIAIQTSDADFVLLPATGTIAGRAFDDASGEPLAAAAVTVDDGAGHLGEDTTLEDGSFSVEGLVPTSAYVVRASLYGYHDAVALDVTPDDDPLDLRLPRNFARLLGTVATSGSGVHLEEVEVVATSTSYGGESRVAVPDPTGSYEVTELRPGTYVASLSAPGCLSTPAQIPVAAGEGETVAGLDFAVELASIERVEVGGPTSIGAGASAVFSGAAIADGNRVVEAELAWWVSPSCAGTMERATGSLVCSEDYIGEATVAAMELGSGVTGRVRVSVYAPIDATTSAVYSDSSGMVLEIDPGAVQAARSVHLTREEVPDAKRYRESYEVAPVSYELKPTGLVFEEDKLPHLSLPGGGGTDMVLWNEDELAWERVDAEGAGGAVEAEVARLGEYATSTESAPLGIADLRSEPNPFSPHDGPVVLSYDLSSSRARMPFVTVSVYNMASQLVRTIADNEPQGKGRASVEWDGLTDDGDLARNGRYVVEVRAEDSSGVDTALTTVVLVK